MFTGIIEETGKVSGVRKTAAAIKLEVDAGKVARGVKIGDSMAVNGCCLTVVRMRTVSRRRRLTFDLLKETWERTNLKHVQRGSLVNLERPLAAGGRLDGHFVTGHIDGVGRIVRWEPSGADYVLEVAADRALMRYVVYKGSIAIDGISLTVAAVLKGRFRIWIIPHTYDVTALREREVGDEVNLETDILGKYVERFVRR